jgi:hypothetical protein
MSFMQPPDFFQKSNEKNVFFSVFFSRFFDRFLTLVFAVFAQHVQCTMYMYIVLYILYTGMNIGVHFILYRRIS